MKMCNTETLPKQKVKPKRITIMFMVITIVFTICYIPKLVWMVVESVNTDFWVQVSDEQFGGLFFLYSFVIVNNIVNPFIYSSMDKKFQMELKQMCCHS